MTSPNRALQQYAQRGVFRSFSRTTAAGGQEEFRFHWLWNLPFRLTFDSNRKSIAFPKLLPNIPPGSDLESELKDFIRSCCAPDRPEHRRLDPQRVSVRYSNRQGAVNLRFVLLNDDQEYAARKALHLVNEIFLGFLNLRHPEYMADNFHRPRE